MNLGVCLHEDSRVTGHFVSEQPCFEKNFLFQGTRVSIVGLKYSVNHVVNREVDIQALLFPSRAQTSIILRDPGTFQRENEHQLHLRVPGTFTTKKRVGLEA